MLQTIPDPRTQLISTLSRLRQEWQEAASGESLLNIDANVGLMFADLVNAFGLSIHEQSLTLGPELFGEMQEILASPSQN
jgi:hypothetical protein